MSEMEYINGKWVEQKKGDSLMGSIIGFVGTFVAIYFTLLILRAAVLGWLIAIEWVWKKIKTDPKTAKVFYYATVIALFAVLGRLHG